MTSKPADRFLSSGLFWAWSRTITDDPASYPVHKLSACLALQFMTHRLIYAASQGIHGRNRAATFWKALSTGLI